MESALPSVTRPMGAVTTGRLPNQPVQYCPGTTTDYSG
uniref:Uncharacterized protein n=1 Tax=Setaria italica TaxID=4555 RepID=K3YF86_SETIT